MAKYKITVVDMFDGKTYTGIFISNSETNPIGEVRLQAKEFYAQELDTTVDQIQIVNIKEV